MNELISEIDIVNMSDTQGTRLFKRGKNKKPKSYNLHILIIDTIKKIADARAVNESALVGDILDEYLTHQVRLGLLENPQSQNDTPTGEDKK